MDDRESHSSTTTQSMKNTLIRRIRSRDGGMPQFVVRSAARAAVGGVRFVGGGVAHLGRDAIAGAVRAIKEVGGEAGSMVRDAMAGVVEGTNQVVSVAAPAVRDMVTGAIRSSKTDGSNAAEVGRNAMEGAIVGAVTVGIDRHEAAVSAESDAVDAMTEVGVETADAAWATVRGVVSGVAASDGDVVAASEAVAYTMVAHDALEGSSSGEMVSVAERAVDAALSEVTENSDLGIEVVAATASGAVAAGYMAGQSRGDHVRRSVLMRLSRSVGHATPELAVQVSRLRDRLAEELPKGRGAWRGRAMYRAARSLVHEGGLDLAASLAYYTVLSFFPMMALVALAVALFADPESVGQDLATLIVHYFPASADLLIEAVQQLFQGTLVMGLVALVGTLLGANALFMAVNRAVNRLFGVESRGLFSTTLSEVVVATSAVVLFAVSMWLTALLQVGIGFHEELAGALGAAAGSLIWSLGVLSALIPALMTALLFTTVYHYMPNVPVHWRDAVYGGLVATLLFEAGKHLFFWLSGMATQWSLVYGPMAAFVVLLMWAFISGLIFLYGAALAKAAGELRPERH